jgi:hypothetical protein
MTHKILPEWIVALFLCGGVSDTSKEDLIKAKTAAARHKDLDDIEHLQG